MESMNILFEMCLYEEEQHNNVVFCGMGSQRKIGNGIPSFIWWISRTTFAIFIDVIFSENGMEFGVSQTRTHIA